MAYVITATFRGPQEGWCRSIQTGLLLGKSLLETLTRTIAETVLPGEKVELVLAESPGIFVSDGRCARMDDDRVRLDVVISANAPLAVPSPACRTLEFPSAEVLALFVSLHELAHLVIQNVDRTLGICAVPGPVAEAHADIWALGIMQDFFGISPKVFH